MNNELELFINACIKKGLAEKTGDNIVGNKQYVIIQSMYQVLRDNNRLHELVDLLNHEDSYVKLWSAFYILQIKPKEAEKVLKELSKIKGDIVGFSAKKTLEEWKKGNLIY